MCAPRLRYTCHSTTACYTHRSVLHGGPMLFAHRPLLITMRPLLQSISTRLVQALALLVLVGSLAACDGGDDPTTPPMETPSTLADLVGQQDNLTTLAAAVEAAGLGDALSGDDALTVFAPSNAAFEALTVDDLTSNTELLTEVLQYHIVSGPVLAGDLSDGQTIETLQGDQLRVSISDGTVRINGATVTTADVQADNGVAHIIDGVLLENRTAVERLSVTAATQTIAGAVETAGLSDAFAGAQNWTVFTPVEEAFDGVDLTAFSQADLAEILQYHVIVDEDGGPITSTELIGLLEDNNGEVSVEALQGENITFTQQEDGTIVLNGGQATLVADGLDIYTDNFTNIAHLIDGVLLPSAFRPTPDAVSYDLTAQSNGGAVPNGVDATATFWRLSDTQTLVTLELTDGNTGADVGHPAHIHNNSASEGGGIEIYLSPIDGSRGGGTSARVVDLPIEDLIDFNGYINIHESAASLGTVVSQGNIGANAPGTVRTGLDRPAMPRSTSYALDANTNSGSVAPDGVPATATFLELTDALTLVSLNLDINGATGASVSHAAHIHNGTASEGGAIEYPLSPIDGGDPDSRSSKIVAASYDDLTSFAGYINIHESVANLADVVSQGNIGASTGGADVTVTINNVGASEWEVTDVEGASGVAGSGNNPDLTLTVGTRYRFVNNGGGAHPLGFQNASDEYLLNQDGAGSLENDANINYEEDGDGVTFTYTQALADAVDAYRCTVHASMEGAVQTN